MASVGYVRFKLLTNDNYTSFFSPSSIRSFKSRLSRVCDHNRRRRHGGGAGRVLEKVRERAGGSRDNVSSSYPATVSHTFNETTRRSRHFRRGFKKRKPGALRVRSVVLLRSCVRRVPGATPERPTGTYIFLGCPRRYDDDEHITKNNNVNDKTRFLYVCHLPLLSFTARSHRYRVFDTRHTYCRQRV